MVSVPEIFGSMVFGEDVMKRRLPSKIYENLKKSIDENSPLDSQTAEVVAQAMKEWALEKGATHFTHWFQPMNGITAEKHSSFLDFNSNGNIEMNFSVKELIKGESDASSFPSGGLRAVFEARGYTSWDPTSYAFVKDNSLYIPSFFCSYSGEVLDEKTPLLKSIYALNKQSLRILNLLGNDKIKKITPSVGAEQEYFLVDKGIYNKRKDIMFCGRTLFGSKPPKTQDVSNHYFGSIRPRVSKFMQHLDEELWKLGIPSKIKHNEVAPAQHEVAQIHVCSNLAVDQNHLIMEVLKTVAEKHDLICLLHEKPFEGINGSGKHNNWSLCSDTGVNLLEPGKSPQDNLQFLIFLCAIMKAVDEYADLLRISISSYGNDFRLGAQEAPPTIISVYLGEEITDILESIEKGEIYTKKKRNNFGVGLNVLPSFPCDTSDRNRTSPFAFTGNKFEFRMVGSNQSIASTNMILNTIVAQSLKEFSDELEQYANPSEHLTDLLIRIIKRHKRIIFNGNSYSKEWENESKRRGLTNFKTSIDALKHSLDEKNIQLFETHAVLSKKELVSRYEIHMENYYKMLLIEAKILVEMVKGDILPAVSKYTQKLSENIASKTQLKYSIPLEYEIKTLEYISNISSTLYKDMEKLEIYIKEMRNISYDTSNSNEYKNKISKIMLEIRQSIDKIEENISNEYWPYPKYEDILFSV